MFGTVNTVVSGECKDGGEWDCKVGGNWGCKDGGDRGM